MNYYNQKCPHCKKVFTKDDDIVVCPICGTPQHRECYEEENKCVNSEKHAQGFVWQADSSTVNEKINDNQDSEADFIVCNNCGTPNSNDAFFCKHCSAPLNADNHNKGNNSNSNSNGFQPNINMGTNSQNNTAFYDMFNVDDNDKIDENVTIGEANKYIKNNTIFYDIVFKRIAKYNRSRFNFSAFVFSGGWFLYRKQYLIGTILTVLMAISLFGYAFFYVPSYQLYMSLTNGSNVTSTELYNAILSLSPQQQFVAVAPELFKMIQYALMIVSGFIANRCYYKDVVKKVKKAKVKFENSTELNSYLDKKGGVDKVLAYILFVGYLILLFLPNFLIRF